MLKRDSKGSDTATLNRAEVAAEEADVEMVAVRQMLCFLGFVGILKKLQNILLISIHFQECERSILLSIHKE